MIVLAVLGTITGTVVFDGKAPERKPIERDSDPVCAATAELDEAVVVTGGKLRDVLVRVTGGPITIGTPVVPAPLVVTQHHCQYAPRVSAIYANQPIVIKNGDQTYHNVHATLGTGGKTLFNASQPAGDPDITKSVTVAIGDVVYLHCDVHAWMQAWAVVVDNPYYAVTADDGAFTIPGDLPPGTYTLEAWHPTLGKQTAKVTIKRGAHATAKTTFHFKAAK